MGYSRLCQLHMVWDYMYLVDIHFFGLVDNNIPAGTDICHCQGCQDLQECSPRYYFRNNRNLEDMRDILRPYQQQYRILVDSRCRIGIQVDIPHLVRIHVMMCLLSSLLDQNNRHILTWVFKMMMQK